MTKNQMQAVIEFDKAIDDMVDAKGYAYTLGFLQAQFRAVVGCAVPKTRQSRTFAETAQAAKELTMRVSWQLISARDGVTMVLVVTETTEVDMTESNRWVVMCTYRVHGHVKTWMSEVLTRKAARKVAKLMKRQPRYDFVNTVSVW